MVEHKHENNASLVWWGTAKPDPLYDWSGPDYKTPVARPGDNLYTSSVIALDIDTGKLKFFHHELPHDTWDFDSAVGEFVSIDRQSRALPRSGQKMALLVKAAPTSRARSKKRRGCG
jgi:alcohol dehydrogenase (cytochrome c)